LDRFKKVFYENASLPPTVISEIIKRDFYSFNNQSRQGDDDITFLILQLKDKDKTEYKFEIKSTKAEIKRLEMKLDSIIPDTNSGKIMVMGIHELVVNAAEHGNDYQKEKSVIVDIIIADEYFYAVIADEGSGFDWRTRMSSSFNLGCDSERGRGIAITKMSCDYIFYNEKGNKSYILKYRQVNS
jgi:anti-sigma regulatory factor (Ser/Thr protein kinase)